jgi:hypothetical protein
VALGLLLNPLSIIPGVLAAIFLRRRWLSLAVAVGGGAAIGLFGPLGDLYAALFTPRGLSALDWSTLALAAMYAVPNFFWWSLTRWLRGLRQRRPSQPQTSP